MQHKVAVALLYGLGGRATSPGIANLYDEIKKISPLIAVLVPYDQSQWQQALSDLKKYTVEKHVVIGYSMGANATTFVANRLKNVALVVAIQPTLYESAEPLDSHVEKAIEIYNPNVAETLGLGSRTLAPTNKWQRIINSDNHAYADEDPAAHKVVLDEIKKLL